MKTQVRVRFAPSPTGFLHIGAIRSSLFNYLFARANDGQFILRLEDTDRERFVPEAEAHLVESLKWLGIGPDEGIGSADGDFGPYVQSERLAIYAKQAKLLIAAKALYPCWCTAERLSDLRLKAQADHVAFKYDRYCLEHPKDRAEPHVLRFFIPENQIVSWDDAVRGNLEFKTADIDDFVAVKSDGFPTYQFANVVDDHLMQISHVLRADEWIPSTPKHILLYQAFDWTPPVFAHLPAVTAPGGGKKLSKRDGAKSALELRDEGYLPEAIINFLASLGWNAGDGSTKEIYSVEELIHSFSLERIQKSPAVFDAERLTWLNGYYIRTMELDKLLERCGGFWTPAGAQADVSRRREALALVQERLKFLAELAELTDFFFEDPNPNEISEQSKLESTDLKSYLKASIETLTDTKFDHDSLSDSLRELAEHLNIKVSPLFSSLRIAITGKTAAPGLFETMTVLGKETVLRRLKAALQAI